MEDEVASENRTEQTASARRCLTIWAVGFTDGRGSLPSLTTTCANVGPGREPLQTVPRISRIRPWVLVITGKPTLAPLSGPQFLPRLTPGRGRMAG